MDSFEEVFGFWVGDFLTTFSIYLAIVIPFYLVFHIYFKDKLKHRRIQEIDKTSKKILSSEIKYTVSTLLIFSIVDINLYFLEKSGYTRMYKEISEYGWGYFVFTIILMIFIHDTYFYWTHRMMHHPKLYKYIHKIHHQSIDPTPFTAFSFHPLEALIEAGSYILFSFLFPVHLFAILSWQLIQMILNVIGHLGYEIYPKGFNTHPIFKFKTPSTHHNMHHSKFNGNYGLYFTFWDTICKTEFKEYHSTFEKVQEKILLKSKV